MLFDVIVVVCVAFAAAGSTMLLFRLFGRRAPKGLVLVAAGLGMLAYTQWERYTWADRTIAALPETTAVVKPIPYDGILEFWARAIPRTEALVVVDRAATLTHPDRPDIVLAKTVLLARHADPLELRQIVDCAKRRRAPVLTPDATIPPPGDWIEDGEPAALYRAVCSDL